jgi:hypothetical protein
LKTIEQKSWGRNELIEEATKNIVVKVVKRNLKTGSVAAVNVKDIACEEPQAYSSTDLACKVPQGASVLEVRGIE